LLLLSLALFYTVVLYCDPVQRCCPQSSFFPLFFCPIVVQSVSYSRCIFESAVMERRTKFAFSLSLSLNDCLSLFLFEQEEYWVALFQDNFIQSVGQCCIYFLCSLSRCKITTLYELSSSIMSIETQLCEYIYIHI